MGQPDDHALSSCPGMGLATIKYIKDLRVVSSYKESRGILVSTFIYVYVLYKVMECSYCSINWVLTKIPRDSLYEETTVTLKKQPI